MSSNPSSGEVASEALDLNSAAIAADHVVAVVAEPAPSPMEGSVGAGESAAETLAEPPECSFGLSGSSDRKQAMDAVVAGTDLGVEAAEGGFLGLGDEMKIGGTESLDSDEKLEAKIGEGEIPPARDAMEEIDAGDDGDQKEEVGEELLEAAEKQSVRTSIAKSSIDAENDRLARYYLPLYEEKAGFSVPDMVWGKVKSHPWWPGQIFGPTDASEMALKHQKKDHFLVAYFGDKSFAWCDESRLKPFESYFSQMEKQSSMDAFVSAVNAALEEVSRRIELGLTCCCSVDEFCSNMMLEKVENAGIREGTCSSSVDKSLIANSFQPDRLLEYIQALAQNPLEGANRLEFVTAKAQLNGFYRSKGYPELPVFVLGLGLIENDAEVLSALIKKSGEDVIDDLNMTPSEIIPEKRSRGRPRSSSKPKNISEDGRKQKRLSGYTDSIPSDMILEKKRSRGRPRSSSKSKNISEDGRKQKSLSELMKEKDAHHLTNGSRSAAGVKSSSRSSGRKRKVAESDTGNSGRNKKKRLDALGDLETNSSSPTIKSSLKVGERLRQVARQLKDSSPVLECNGETFPSTESKAGRRRGRGVGTHDLSRTHVEIPRKSKGTSEEYTSPSEMLSQLYLAARDPVKGYSFLSMIVSFFIDFRESLTSNSSKDMEDAHSAEKGKRDRKKLDTSESTSLETSVPYFMRDSYWSDILLHSSPEGEPVSRGRKRKGKSQKQKKKTKPAGEPSVSTFLDRTLDTMQDLLVGSTDPTTERELEGERPVASSLEKTIDEATPTALILSFTQPDALPSEADLIRIFSPYGPLKETETEVFRKTNRAKVVFLSHADAEVAFSSAGKYSIFGPALVSYRLRYLQSSPKESSDDSPQDKTNASPSEGGNSELTAQGDNGLASNNMQAEAMGK